jgi:hypothetical protein
MLMAIKPGCPIARPGVFELPPGRASEQALSDLLSAAFGVNRPQTRGRTAPSAHDWEEIDIAGEAPLALIYVANLSRMTEASSQE